MVRPGRWMRRVCAITSYTVSKQSGNKCGQAREEDVTNVCGYTGTL